MRPNCLSFASPSAQTTTLVTREESIVAVLHRSNPFAPVTMGQRLSVPIVTIKTRLCQPPRGVKLGFKLQPRRITNTRVFTARCWAWKRCSCLWIPVIFVLRNQLCGVGTGIIQFPMFSEVDFRSLMTECWCPIIIFPPGSFFSVTLGWSFRQCCTLLMKNSLFSWELPVEYELVKIICSSWSDAESFHCDCDLSWAPRVCTALGEDSHPFT